MLCHMLDRLISCELLYDYMFMCTWLLDWGWVEAGPALCCRPTYLGGPVIPKAQRAVRIGCRPQEGGPDVPMLGEWTRPTEGLVQADQSYCRLREWTGWIEGPVWAYQSHCRLDVYG